MAKLSKFEVDEENKWFIQHKCCHYNDFKTLDMLLKAQLGNIDGKDKVSEA
jgi:hypothetical protein